MFAWCGGFIKYGHWRGPTEGLEEPHKSWSVVGTCRYLVVFYGFIDTLGHLGAGCHTFYTPVRHYTDTRQISRKDRLYLIRDRTRDLPMRSLARCHSTTDSPTPRPCRIQRRLMKNRLNKEECGLRKNQGPRRALQKSVITCLIRKGARPSVLIRGPSINM